VASNGNNRAYDLAEATNYQDYTVDNVHEYDPGLFVLPVASEVSETVTVRVHGGYGKRIIKYNIAKTGNPPVVPMPKATVGDDTLVSSVIHAPTPIPNLANGNYDWTVSGTYIYVNAGGSRVPGETTLPAVGYPYSIAVQDARAQQSGQTEDEIITEIKVNNLIMDGGWVWPLVSFPTTLMMNPNLIQV